MKPLRQSARTTAPILTRYIHVAMSKAEYEKLPDGRYAGRIPPCPGVLAFAASLEECRLLLHSVLEEWILLGLQFGDPLPVIDGINLNPQPKVVRMRRA